MRAPIPAKIVAAESVIAKTQSWFERSRTRARPVRSRSSRPAAMPSAEVEPAHEVRERAAAAQRRAALRARHREQPAGGLRHDVVARLARARARLAEARERRHHEARVPRLEHVGAEPAARQVAGAEVLDERVGAVHEPQQDLAALGRAEVERDGALAAVRVLEGERRLAHGRGAVAIVVARLRALDLDHLGAEVGEHRGRERPRDDAREIEDAEALERPAGAGTFIEKLTCRV